MLERRKKNPSLQQMQKQNKIVLDKHRSGPTPKLPRWGSLVPEGKKVNAETQNPQPSDHPLSRTRTR